VKITLRGNRIEEVEANLEKLERIIRDRLQGRVIAADEETLEGTVGRLLREHQATLAVAESCTGGLVAHRLTQVPGSSDYFDRSVVVYSNGAKIQMLGVPESLISSLGAVSAEVAERMAKGVRQVSGTTLGLAITGIAGPRGDRKKNLWERALSHWTARREPSPNVSASRGSNQIQNLSAYLAIDWVRRYFLNLLSAFNK